MARGGRSSSDVCQSSGVSVTGVQQKHLKVLKKHEKYLSVGEQHNECVWEEIFRYPEKPFVRC